MSLPSKPDEMHVKEIEVPVIAYRGEQKIWASVMTCRFDPRCIRCIANIRKQAKEGKPK